MQSIIKEKNRIHKENEKIIYDGEDILIILKEINYILCSLHDMGSYYCDKEQKDYELETTQFVDKSLICERLAGIRAVLCEQICLLENEEELNDIEVVCQEIPYWEKPGDRCKEIWIKKITDKYFV